MGSDMTKLAQGPEQTVTMSKVEYHKLMDGLARRMDRNEVLRTENAQLQARIDRAVAELKDWDGAINHQANRFVAILEGTDEQ